MRAQEICKMRVYVPKTNDYRVQIYKLPIMCTKH